MSRMCTCSYASVAGHVGASRLRMDHADGNLHNYSPNRYLSIWHLRTLDMTWSREVPCTTASNARSTLKTNWTNKIPRHLPYLEETYLSKFTHQPTTRLPWLDNAGIWTNWEEFFQGYFKIIYVFTCTWNRISLQVGLYRVIAYIAFWAGAWFGEFGVLWIVNTSIFLLESLMNMIMIIFSMPWQVR